MKLLFFIFIIIAMASIMVSIVAQNVRERRYSTVLHELVQNERKLIDEYYKAIRLYNEMLDEQRVAFHALRDLLGIQIAELKGLVQSYKGQAAEENTKGENVNAK